MNNVHNSKIMCMSMHNMTIIDYYNHNPSTMSNPTHELRAVEVWRNLFENVQVLHKPSTL